MHRRFSTDHPLLVLCVLIAALTTAAAGETPLPSSPGHHKCTMTATVRVPGEKPGDAEREVVMTVPYSIYLPRSYFTGGSSPMLVWLHGAGERGRDLSNIYAHGPDPNLMGNPPWRAVFPFVVLAPQCAPNRPGVADLVWNDPAMARATIACVDHVLSRMKIDRDRVYLTGASMGGTGTWAVAATAPDRFAAIAPFCGRAYAPETTAAALKGLPVYIAVGGNDGHFTAAARTMAAAFVKQGSPATLAVVAEGQHMFFGQYFANPRFYTWFLRHRRGVPRGTPPDEATMAHIDALRAAGSPLPRLEGGDPPA